MGALHFAPKFLRKKQWRTCWRKYRHNKLIIKSSPPPNCFRNSRPPIHFVAEGHLTTLHQDALCLCANKVIVPNKKSQPSDARLALIRYIYVILVV